mgnify:CR=1 FL=1
MKRLKHELKEKEREIEHLKQRISVNFLRSLIQYQELQREVHNKNILNKSYLFMDHESQVFAHKKFS